MTTKAGALRVKDGAGLDESSKGLWRGFRLMRAGRLMKWALVGLLSVQTACGGGLLAGVGPVRSLVSGASSRVSAGFNLFTPEQDVELGRASAAEVARQSAVVEDERVTRYVQRLGDKIASRAPGYRFQYKFVVVDSPETNAFALPGGYVFVNSGAIEAARNEGELAGVLAHEISHVVLRHGTNQASKAYVAKSAMRLIDAALGGAKDDVRRLAYSLGLAGPGRLFVKSNRDAELQADVEGARLMAAAGYDPRDMASFFESLGERDGGAKANAAADDHPDPAARAAAIDGLLPTLDVSASPLHDTEEFRQMKSRL
ncbi:MAG TPA: M48 family metallopeptidase [Pyrinomonadaceae bacterium]|nr:M48 family metallopeptidase [Pyrinomonadaceae bacterium]